MLMGQLGGSCSKTETQRDTRNSAYANKYTKPSLPQKCFKITERKKLYLARTSEIFIHNVLFSSWSDITNNVIITELIQCTVVI